MEGGFGCCSEARENMVCFNIDDINITQRERKLLAIWLHSSYATLSSVRMILPGYRAQNKIDRFSELGVVTGRIGKGSWNVDKDLILELLTKD